MPLGLNDDLAKHGCGRSLESRRREEQTFKGLNSLLYSFFLTTTFTMGCSTEKQTSLRLALCCCVIQVILLESLGNQLKFAEALWEFIGGVYPASGTAVSK